MPTTREQLREARIENRLRAEQIKSHRLAAAERRQSRRRDMMESLSVDWVTPYMELLDLTRRSGDPVFSGPTSAWQRREGRNWPIYQTEQELNLLRAPARVLLATVSYAQGLVEGLTSYVLGSGCTYRIAKADDKDTLPDDLIDAAQDAVDDILEENQWFGGEQPGIEEETFGRSIEDGEFILCHYPQADGTCEFRVREPECLTQPPGSDTREYGFGILTPPNDATKIQKYYLQFGETPEQGEEYEPDEVTHFRRNVRRAMKRGITDFCFDTYDALSLAGKLRTNLGTAAAQQAAIVGVRQHENGTQQEVQAFVDADANFNETKYLTGNQIGVKLHRRGDWEDIPKGLNYVPGPGAQNAEAHVKILDTCLRGAGQKWQAPPWIMSGDLNAMNYATSLTAESPFVKTVLRRQRGYTEAYRRAIWFAVKHRIQTRGLRDRTGKVWHWEEIEKRIKLSVTAPSPETRDKNQEAQRAQTEIQLGVQSRQAYMQEQGRNPDQIEADNQAYAKKFGPTGQIGQPPKAEPELKPPVETKPVVESLAIPAVDLNRVLLESGFTGTITDKAGHKRTYEDGKQVASTHPGESDGKTPDSHLIDLGDLERSPDIAKHPGLLAKIKEHATRAVKQTVALLSDPKAALYAIAYHTPQILTLWTDTLGDHPDDLKKIGYNPAFGGNNHSTTDPMKDAIGLSSHQVCGLVVKIGAAAIAAVKDKFAQRTESLESVDDGLMQKATFFHEMLKAIATELGLNAPPSAAEIAENLKAL